VRPLSFSLFQISHTLNTVGYEERLPEYSHYSKVSLFLQTQVTTTVLPQAIFVTLEVHKLKEIVLEEQAATESAENWPCWLYNPSPR